MTDEKRRFRLGLFMLAGIVLLAVGVLTLSAGRLFQKTHPLYCYFEENVQGLEPGNPVKFRGVEIGRVDSVNVMPGARIASPADAREAAALIEVRSSLLVEKISDQTASIVDRGEIDSSIAQKVHDGLRVRLAWKDITGQKYLDLDFYDPKESQAKTLAFTPPGSYVPTATERTFSDIQRDVGEVASKLARLDYQTVLDEARALIASLRKTVEQLESGGLSARIGDAADSVRDLARNPKIETSLTSLESSIARIDSAAVRLDEILARPSIPAALDDIAASAASFRRVTAEIEESVPKVTKSLDETLAAARKSIDDSRLSDTTAAARESMSEVGNAARQLGALRESAKKTLTELGVAARNLGELVKYLEENPAALLKGRTEEAR
jgi:ABC-type transporter Mla subunit MlaD